jgi:hypothetical protein
MATYQVILNKSTITVEYFLVDADDEQQALTMANDDFVQPVAIEVVDTIVEPVEVQEIE